MEGELAYWISQTPVMKGEIRGSFEIARADPPHVPPPAADTPEAPATTAQSSPSEPENPAAAAENPLLRQARSYRHAGEFDQAIEMYGRAIQDVSLDPAIRRQAYHERGIAHLAKGARTDIEQALRDHISAGRKLHVAVTAATAPLQVGQEVQGTVVQNQMLTIGLEEGDWLWVEEVNGDPKLRGYIQKSAVERVAAGGQSSGELAAGSTPEAGQYRGTTTGRASYAEERESPGAAARERRLDRLEEQHETAVEERHFAKAKALESQLRPLYRAQDRSSSREEGGRRSR